LNSSPARPFADVDDLHDPEHVATMPRIGMKARPSIASAPRAARPASTSMISPFSNLHVAIGQIGLAGRHGYDIDVADHQIAAPRQVRDRG
jgi:hypothetical protein